MKKISVLLFCGFSLVACNNEPNKEKPAETSGEKTTAAVDLPYTPSYGSNWSSDVSDADLKTVLMTYKDWADANMSGLSKEMGDSIVVDMSNGEHLAKTNAELMKIWKTNRDSLSSVKIEMTAWHKMYSTDKKQAFVVTWYDETDTYKTGKIDSATFHDINGLKDGKIVYYGQYKRPKK
jgi:ketosteroid isomerase-like protein